MKTASTYLVSAPFFPPSVTPHQLSTNLWHVFLLSYTDEVFEHGHHRRRGDHMTVDQV